MNHSLLDLLIRTGRIRLAVNPGEGGSGDQTPTNDSSTNDPGADPNTNPDDQNHDNDDENLGANGLKALKAERENVKMLKAQLAKQTEKLKEYEDANKTEAEKQAERLAELEKTSAAVQKENMQIKVASAKGLPIDIASRLQGATKEEMEADAENLLKLMGNQSHKPQADPSQGHSGEAKPHSFYEALMNHYK